MQFSFSMKWESRTRIICQRHLTSSLSLWSWCKNQTSQRSYKLQDWTGNTALSESLLMDPKVVLLTWFSVRGPSDGLLFWDIAVKREGTCKINRARPLSSAKFNTLMRGRLRSIGIGAGDMLMYSGLWLKRVSVQLHRSLGLSDDYVMQRVEMVRPKLTRTIVRPMMTLHQKTCPDLQAKMSTYNMLKVFKRGRSCCWQTMDLWILWRK